LLQRPQSLHEGAVLRETYHHNRLPIIKLTRCKLPLQIIGFSQRRILLKNQQWKEDWCYWHILRSVRKHEIRSRPLALKKISILRSELMLVDDWQGSMQSCHVLNENWAPIFERFSLGRMASEARHSA
jgi:hypothetical protein